MKINFDTELKDFRGKVVEENVGGKRTKITLKEPCMNALLNPSQTPNAVQETGVEKFKKYNLAKKISEGGEIELTAEEISKIKNSIGLFYSPMMVGLCYELLEGKKEEGKDVSKE